MVVATETVILIHLLDKVEAAEENPMLTILVVLVVDLEKTVLQVLLDKMVKVLMVLLMEMIIYCLSWEVLEEVEVRQITDKIWTDDTEPVAVEEVAP